MRQCAVVKRSVILKDQFHAKTNINESELNAISRLVEGYSGIAVAPNQPIVGENVFTQVAGVHADGDNKDNLYCNDLMPERFGRKREYALGKTSGNANIARNLQELGLELTPEQTKKITQRITELGDRKEIVTQEDLPFIVSDVLKHTAPEDKVRLVSYMVSSAYGLKPLASVKVCINGNEYEGFSTGDGQYDAFVKALRKIYRDSLGRTFPTLANYASPYRRGAARMHWCRRSSHGAMAIRCCGHEDSTPTRPRLQIKGHVQKCLI